MCSSRHCRITAKRFGLWTRQPIGAILCLEPFCAEFACFLRVLRLPYTPNMWRLIGNSRLSVGVNVSLNVRLSLWVSHVMNCPGYTLRFTQCHLGSVPAPQDHVKDKPDLKILSKNKCLFFLSELHPLPFPGKGDALNCCPTLHLFLSTWLATSLYVSI